MKRLTAFILLLTAVITGAFAYGFHSGDFFAEFGRIIALPWGLATLVDVYIGFILVGLWIFWREADAVRALLCFLPLLLLGNLYACLYILYAIFTSAGDMRALINGKRR